MASHTSVPVVIIGGGGTGLCLSIFLSFYNIPHVLFEKHSGTSLLPKAHYLNQRTMEIFRHYGLSEELNAVAAPIHHMSKIEWKTSLGGDNVYDGKVLGSIRAFGGQPDSPEYQAYMLDSPVLSSNLPLIRLEPLLRRVAEERNPGAIKFNHHVTDFVEKENSVLVSVKQPDGRVVSYTAKYLVAADGGKLSSEKLGVRMHGPTGIQNFTSVYFKADLSEYWDDRTLITRFISPETPDGGTMIQMGPTWGRKSEEWAIHLNFPPNAAPILTNEELTSKIRRLLKLPDLNVDILKSGNWALERVVAHQYRFGHIFIAGDAAHRRPPTSGTGLNTSIEDANNLAFKLALVLSNKASVSLLDTYELERRPIGIRNADWALFTSLNIRVLQASVGIVPGETERNKERFTSIFADTTFGRPSLEQIRRIVSTQRIEFSAHGFELGFTYDEHGAARLSDGTEGPFLDPLGQIYLPTTRPGHRLPHTWLLSGSGKLVSTLDLVQDHDFLLITDEFGTPWVEAAGEFTKLRIATAIIRTRQVVQGNGLYYDYHERWSKVREIKDGGAILVRPDNFVAWRSHDPCDDATRIIGGAIGRLLGEDIIGRVKKLGI